jgi:hypothetical protein
MTKYKFRAECVSDVEAFKDNLRELGTFSLFVKQMQIDGIPVPDVEVELEVDSNMEQVLDTMRRVVDSHVMIQTLELAANYTGDRVYDRK